MGRLKLFLITVLALTSWVHTSAQSLVLQNIKEQTRLDTNSNLIFSGDELLYRVVVQADNQERSEIAYVNLMDDTGKTLFFHKVAINEKGIGSDSFTIPTDAKTGNYKLLSYTSWSKNNTKSAYFSQDLVIINPFIPLQQKIPANAETYTITQKEGPNEFADNSSPLNLQLDAQKYATRKEVLLNITVANMAFEANYGLSIRQVQKAQPDQKLRAYFIDQEKKRNEIYLPEIKGELISGTLKSEGTSAAVSDQLVSLSIPGEKSLYKLTKSNNKGKFIFLIDQPYDTSQAIIQTLDTEDDFKIVIDKIASEPAEKLNYKNVVLDPSLANWITEQSIDLQIENAYKELPINNKEDSTKNLKFYDPFAIRYVLDDYTRFPSMHETFTEILELAAMRIDAEQVRVLIYNTNPIIRNELDKLAPLVLIDGIQIQDFSLLANLNPARVDFIDIVPHQYRYGPKIFGGIVAVSTKENNFKLPENSVNTLNFELLASIKTADFEPKTYQNTTDLNRIPDYRTQLYWDPQVAITQKPQHITFFTSDKQGIFEIALTGYSVSGEKIEVKKTFRVSAEQ